MSSPRHAAWRILRSGRTTPLREVDRVATAFELDDRDRSLLRHLVGSEVRQRATLRAIVRHFAKGKPSPDVAAHLRLGVLQLCFLDRIPPHAAVSETVRACADTVSLARARYVNGVLRSVQRALRKGTIGEPRRDLIGRELHFTEDVFRDPKAHPLLWIEDAYSMPATLMKRWRKRYGEEDALALARQALEPPPLSLVCLGTEREAIASELDFPTRMGAHPALLLAEQDSIRSLLASPAFQAGRVVIQGETALRAAELLAPVADERLLDLCAAPGGKTAILARTGAKVLALDKNPTRLAPLAETLQRLGIVGVNGVASDGTSALRADACFDGVLVDAPCSNTGVLAARPGARWRFGPASLRDLGLVQERLLEEAARRAPRLVYSVCSIEPEEGPRRVRAFLDRHSDWSLEEELAALPSVQGPVDGGYAALLRRG